MLIVRVKRGREPGRDREGSRETSTVEGAAIGAREKEINGNYSGKGSSGGSAGHGCCRGCRCTAVLADVLGPCLGIARRRRRRRLIQHDESFHTRRLLECRDLGDLGVGELKPEQIEILLRVGVNRSGVAPCADRHDRPALQHPTQAHLADPLAVGIRNLLERRRPFLAVA